MSLPGDASPKVGAGRTGLNSIQMNRLFFFLFFLYILVPIESIKWLPLSAFKYTPFSRLKF